MAKEGAREAFERRGRWWMERETDVRAIRVVYGIDRNYLVPAAVSLHSLCECASAPLEIIVYGDGLEPSDHETLLKVGEASGAAIDVRRYDPSSVKDFKRNFHAQWPAILALRLELPWLVRGRCLFIDADTLVVGDVSEIMAIDMRGRPLGACMDPAIDGSWNLAKPRRRLIQRRSSDVLRPKRARRLRESELRRAVSMGLLPGDVYFNAGVLVMECDAIRTLPPPPPPISGGGCRSMILAAWNLILSTFWTRIGSTSSSPVATIGFLCAGT